MGLRVCGERVSGLEYEPLAGNGGFGVSHGDGEVAIDGVERVFRGGLLTGGGWPRREAVGDAVVRQSDIDGYGVGEGPGFGTCGHGAAGFVIDGEQDRALIAYYFMWNEGQPASEQCEGCTWCNNAVSELAYLHSRDITYAVFAQGPYAESKRYHDFMGWEMPWYSATPSLDTLLVDRHIGMMHLICYVREGDRVFETWWTTYRGVQVMDNSYSLMDLTVFGRQEQHEDSPAGWPKRPADWNLLELNGRPMTQWSRLEAGRNEDLGHRR